MTTQCARSELCADDICRRLSRYQLPAGAVGRIVDKLKQERYIDESRYAHAFVRDKFRYNHWGERRIGQELRRRHIDEAIIADALTEISTEDCNETLEALLKKKLQSTSGRNDYEVFMKLLRYSVSRGFRPEDTHRCLQRIIRTPEEEND